jgi:hypothetical protein
MMRSRHKGVDDTHMGFKGRRNPPKRQIGSKSFSEMQSRQKVITRGFKSGYEIMSKSIAFGSPVVNSYAQSSNITSEPEFQNSIVTKKSDPTDPVEFHKIW